MHNPSWLYEIKNLKAGSKKKTYLDDVIRQKEKQGSPPSNIKHRVWGDEIRATSKHGHPHKDEFKKGKRLTVPAQIFEDAKKKKGPD